jgi:4-diphosphocytidyl-2-C-methyl-D-erythritol kinase
MNALANAKVNLALRVQPPRSDGYHPIRGVFQSIDWSDEVGLADAERDEILVTGGHAPEDETNLAWRAADAVRRLAVSPVPMRVTVHKSVPDGAGLGGGSADAAAILILASRRFAVPFEDVRRLAVDLGADVPFALVGGSAIVGGIGELVQPEPDAIGFALAIVVPDLSLDTSAVYSAWDELDGPQGPVFPTDALPPALRDLAPLANDLYPAAVAVDRAVDDWRAELEAAWGIPVAMTGSGSALFAYFPTIEEAEDAVVAAPTAARAVRAASPIDHGWRVLEGDGGPTPGPGP